MQSRSKIFLLVLSTVVAACATSDTPDATATIAIEVDVPPLLVAFRDGLTGAWQPATMKTPTTFEVEVHGPYVVSVVCHEPVFDLVETLQMARTPDDPRTLSTDCVFEPANPHTVTGHMVQAGRVDTGSSGDRSLTADWDFEFPLDSGTYELVATSTDRIKIRRGIVVNGDVAVTPAIDLATEGAALVDVAFTVPNAATDEVLTASVGLLNATNPDIPARIFLGPAATAKAAPSAALLATDTQSVSVRGTTPTSLRALRQPFRVGDAPAFTLPPPIVGGTWTIEGGVQTASWTTLPPHDVVFLSVSGVAVDGKEVSHGLDASSRFVAATGITKAGIDTDIPGYLPAWRLDAAAPYDRLLSTQQGNVLGVLKSSNLMESVNVEPAATQRATTSARQRFSHTHRP